MEIRTKILVYFMIDKKSCKHP